MRCEAAQRTMSESMDEGLAPPDEVEAHRRGCASCSTFARRARRVRELSRFEVAPPVPDLVPAIMARLAQEPRRLRTRGPTPWLVRHREAIVAVAAGLVIGFVLTSGALVPIERTPPLALADEIPRHLVRAAVGLEGYRATFDITEMNWTGDVPRRTFAASIAFRAPESFRVRVRDTTLYPSRDWPRNDLLLMTDGRAWGASGPDPCPRAALPACPRSPVVERAVLNRAPFDSQSPAPTDVIVPMTVLAASSTVKVVSSGDVAGMDAVAVELDFRDAAPLFDYLRFLGSWRPFFPEDRVIVWLDRATWFPLKYQVFPAPGAERSTWAGQEGLPDEDPEAPVFTAEARSVSTAPPPTDLFVPRQGAGAVDQGFREAATGGLEGGAAGLVGPERTEGLPLWRAGRFPRTPARPYDLSVLAYARGLTWLTVTQVQGWNQSSLFGVGSFAEQVSLGSGGVGYYEPASRTEPRRIALHTADGEFLISTNLPRASLVSVASSFPVAGSAEPDGWRIHRWSAAVVESGLTPEAAIAQMEFEVMLPSLLPFGYEPASAMTVRTASTSGFTIMYRRPAAELGGVGLRLYQSTGETLPPPTGADEQIVRIGGSTGRWSPEARVLDWVDEQGVYRSLSGESFDLTTLLEVAESLGQPTEASP